MVIRICLLKIFLARSFLSLSIYNNLKQSIFSLKKFTCVSYSYFYLRRAGFRNLKARTFFIWCTHVYLISASKDQIGHFLDFFINYLVRSIQNIFFSRTAIKRSWILFWDVCHLFWDAKYLSKTYFGIFETLSQGYGIFRVIYYGIWDIGYPTKQDSIMLYKYPKGAANILRVTLST